MRRRRLSIAAVGLLVAACSAQATASSTAGSMQQTGSRTSTTSEAPVSTAGPGSETDECAAYVEELAPLIDGFVEARGMLEVVMASHYWAMMGTHMTLMPPIEGYARVRDRMGGLRSQLDDLSDPPPRLADAVRSISEWMDAYLTVASRFVDDPFGPLDQRYRQIDFYNASYSIPGGETLLGACAAVADEQVPPGTTAPPPTITLPLDTAGEVRVENPCDVPVQLEVAVNPVLGGGEQPEPVTVTTIQPGEEALLRYPLGEVTGPWQVVVSAPGLGWSDTKTSGGPPFLRLVIDTCRDAQPQLVRCRRPGISIPDDVTVVASTEADLDGDFIGDTVSAYQVDGRWFIHVMTASGHGARLILPKGSLVEDMRRVDVVDDIDLVVVDVGSPEGSDVYQFFALDGCRLVPVADPSGDPAVFQTGVGDDGSGSSFGCASNGLITEASLPPVGLQASETGERTMTVRVFRYEWTTASFVEFDAYDWQVPLSTNPVTDCSTFDMCGLCED